MNGRTKVILIGVVVAAMVGIAAVLTGIGDTSNAHPSAHSMTLEAAKQEARQNAAAIVATLPVAPQLDPPDGTDSGGACSQGLQDQVTGQYDSSLNFRLRGVPADRNQDVFAAVRAFAGQHGFKPFGSSSGFESFKDNNGFTISVETSFDPSHTLTLGSSTPCVWPNGTQPRG
ncbi:hypothetical protein ABH935_000635 [Catenulispora sp. GAS73]|uniref:hypothetical protein n=1 Tax=Catenulispora sp. GAS73 TaxID=3156269 RepID=UPI003518E77C